MAQVRTKQNGAGTQPIEISAEKVSPPDKAETAAAALLIEAVNAGDVKNAVEILQAHGVAEETLLDMAVRLGKTPPKAMLEEPFLKATYGSLAVSGPTNRACAQAFESPIPGYERPVMVVRRLSRGSIGNYEFDFAECALPPIAVLNLGLEDPRFIRFFLWFDRYAERVHSVALNGENLSNAKLDPEQYGRANRTLNALFRLIKARKPDAFVWLGVVKQDSKTDELWLKAMTFKPDGLQIWNLRQFHSPFAETRRRYAAIVGNDMPMMVAGFYGQKVALEAKAEALSDVARLKDKKKQQNAEANALTKLGGIGKAVKADFQELESRLRSIGYSGLSVHWLLGTALAGSDKATSVDKSDLVGPRARLLQTYYEAKDYTQLFALAEDMISNSAPGDLDWTLGKLYHGMALLSQDQPKTKEACVALDEVLAFDFRGRPGRDHYLIETVKWRIYAAQLSADHSKASQLVQWVQTNAFRDDLKRQFLSRYLVALTNSPVSTN